jgi:hypothetical protein
MGERRFFVLLAFFAAIIEHATPFDMDAFDKIFQEAYRDPQTEIKVAEYTLESSLRSMNFGAIEKAMQQYKENVNVNSETGMPPLMMSVFPYFFELTIQNLLTKDYLYTNGRFVLNLTNGASETSNAAMELKRAYNATLAHLLASKQKKKRNRLYNHTLFGNFFSKFYPDNLATVPQKLLELGSNVKQTDADGNTALHAACSHGQMKIISVLMQYDDCKLAVRRRNNFGNTPLHVLAIYGHLRAMRYFVNKCAADLLSTNLVGQIPLSLAVLYHPFNGKIRQLLTPKSSNAKFVNNVVAKEVSGANDLRYDSEVVEPGENLQRVINSWLSPLGVALTADGEVSEPPETITAKSLLDRHGIKTDRTDIPRAVLDIETFNSNYFQIGAPVIIQGWKKFKTGTERFNRQFSQDWQRDNFVEKMGSTMVKHGPIPYCDETNPERAVPQRNLSSYVDEMYRWRYNSSFDEKQKVPSYLFHNGPLPSSMMEVWKNVTPMRGPKTREWFSLMNDVQLTIGPSTAGAPIHFHGATVSTLLVGRKHWVMFPPSRSFYTNIPMKEWLAHPEGYEIHKKHALHFTQHPGETVFVPPQWSHGTIVMDSISVAVAENIRDELTKNAILT